MSYFDIAFVLIIGGLGLIGFRFGLVHTLGSLVGTVLGVYLATRYYSPLAEWLIATTGWNANFSRVIIFIIAFVVINRLVGVVFFLIDKALSVVTHLPFIRSVDRLLGFIFGVIEGLVVLGMVIYFINKFPLSPHFMASLATSKLAPYCLQASSLLWPFIPEALKIIKNSLGISL